MPGPPSRPVARGGGHSGQFSPHFSFPPVNFFCPPPRNFVVPTKICFKHTMQTKSAKSLFCPLETLKPGCGPVTNTTLAVRPTQKDDWMDIRWKVLAPLEPQKWDTVYVLLANFNSNLARGQFFWVSYMDKRCALIFFSLTLLPTSSDASCRPTRPNTASPGCRGTTAPTRLPTLSTTRASLPPSTESPTCKEASVRRRSRATICRRWAGDLCVRSLATASTSQTCACYTALCLNDRNQ